MVEFRIEDLRASRRRIHETQVRERRRLARNLHDGAQQGLFAIGITLSRLAASVPDPDLREQLERVHRQAVGLARDIRALAHGLHPLSLTQRGLIAALSERRDDMPAGVSVHLVCDAARRYPAAAEATAYYVAVEALNNVLKHAGATTVVIRIAGSDEHLTIMVYDDGQGGEITPGQGLVGTRDRLEAVGGSLTITSSLGLGTRLEARIPLGLGADQAADLEVLSASDAARAR
jgi:signal transduction histidine kinase